MDLRNSTLGLTLTLSTALWMKSLAEEISLWMPLRILLRELVIPSDICLSVKFDGELHPTHRLNAGDEYL